MVLIIVFVHLPPLPLELSNDHQCPFLRANNSIMFFLPPTCGMNKQQTSGVSKAKGMVAMIETSRGCFAQIKIINPTKNITTPTDRTPRPENSDIATQYSMKPFECLLDRSVDIGGICFLIHVSLRNSTSAG
jgi:hypothetical protein